LGGDLGLFDSLTVNSEKLCLFNQVSAFVSSQVQQSSQTLGFFFFFFKFPLSFVLSYKPVVGDRGDANCMFMVFFFSFFFLSVSPLLLLLLLPFGLLPAALKLSLPLMV
jgi:hypothetical protein